MVIRAVRGQSLGISKRGQWGECGHNHHEFDLGFGHHLECHRRPGGSSPQRELEPGTQGNANAMLGFLMGSGTVTVSGESANLQVTNGAFSGIITGNENLILAGGGALTLSGANSYTGATSIQSGSLVLDTGGSLGTGSVYNQFQLFYIDSATAGTENLTNQGFTDSSITPPPVLPSLPITRTFNLREMGTGSTFPPPETPSYQCRPY